VRNPMVVTAAFIAVVSLASAAEAADPRMGARPASPPAAPVVPQPAAPQAVIAQPVADLTIAQIQVNPQAREGQPVQGVSLVVKNQGRAAGQAGAVKLSCRAAAGSACPPGLASIMLPLASVAPGAMTTITVPPNGRDVWGAGKLTLVAEIVGAPAGKSQSLDLSVVKQLATELRGLNPQPEPPRPDRVVAPAPPPPPPSSPTPQGKAAGHSLSPVQAHTTAMPSPRSQQQTLAELKSHHVPYDPAPKLRELQAVMQSKKSAKIQSIRTEMIPKMKDLKTLACVLPGPEIKSVSPQEVYPGFPIYIGGCHFGTGQGMVSIPQLNTQVQVTSWSDNWIEGTIPDSITGFSDPKTIGFKVMTLQGGVAQAPANVVLRPNMDVVVLPFQLNNPSGQSGKCSETGARTVWDARFENTHLAEAGGTCQGVDGIFQGTQLHNSWTFLLVDLNTECRFYWPSSNASMPMECGGSNDATLAQNLNNWAGKSSVPGFQVKWTADNATGADANAIVSYVGAIYISGPAGTSYK
jgi:hypothetical protein